MTNFMMPLIGGALIGLAASLMMLLNGRVTGVSGITNGMFTRDNKERGWRLAFVLGLMSGGFLLQLFLPGRLATQITASTTHLILAGILVGFGSVLGNGCTSGHGVCGISRLSPRSIIATLVFMATGILTVYFLKIFPQVIP